MCGPNRVNRCFSAIGPARGNLNWTVELMIWIDEVPFCAPVLYLWGTTILINIHTQDDLFPICYPLLHLIVQVLKKGLSRVAPSAAGAKIQFVLRINSQGVIT
jgi:hypothetical protein